MSRCREEFKPAALDDEDDEMSGGESEGSAVNESEGKSASGSAHDDPHQPGGQDNASEGADAGDDKMKSEPENSTPSQLSLSQMREKIAALEKVRDPATP
jgi:hypothetical protein